MGWQGEMIQKMMIPHGTIADKGRAGTHENVDIVNIISSKYFLTF